MIEYRYKEERAIALHYAEVLNDRLAKEILNRSEVLNGDEALHLNKFYWAMVDQAIADNGAGVPVLESEGTEAWMEYIFHSFNGYLVSHGYAREWEEDL
ncbi:hypothetical protein BTA51_05405 [Hahella sp. CCB-MM4]|uniref:hypothetical protein n=1 Tax=Hahella sp. (strain CCB-MM4) TaxID=1926491 RepID=UPI000B9BC68D|nr:hypothetical protein [Hahella sp. CCB-MM4]OZG74446.1 hypothetical protein BTA51_05405 [Hahella sp. CCB-MM4]